MTSRKLSNSLHQKKQFFQPNIQIVTGNPNYFTPPYGTPSGQTYPLNNSLESSMKSFTAVPFKDLNTHWDNLLLQINTFFQLAQNHRDLQNKLLIKNIDRESILMLLQQKKYEIMLVTFLTIINEYITQKKVEEDSKTEIIHQINQGTSGIIPSLQISKIVSQNIENTFSSFRERLKNIIIPDQEFLAPQTIYRTPSSPAVLKSHYYDDHQLSLQQRKETAQFQNSQQSSPLLESERKHNTFQVANRLEKTTKMERMSSQNQRTNASNSPKKHTNSPLKKSEIWQDKFEQKGQSSNQSELPINRSTKSLSKIPYPLVNPKAKKYNKEEIQKDYLSIDHIRKKKKVESSKSYNIITNEGSETEERFSQGKSQAPSLQKVFEHVEEQKLETKKKYL